MSANLKRGLRTHPKEAHSPLITATNMPTTRSQSKAMSTPPISSVLEEPESSKSTSSQETPWSTQSINNTSPLGNQLSPGWLHAITIIMGKSLQSEVGEMLQKWIHYHLIPDHTEFWFSWDPSDPEDFRRLQKYEESDGSIAYLPNNLAKNLVSLWDFMNLLMKKDRPDGENNKLYYLMDKQWTKFTAYDIASQRSVNSVHTHLLYHVAQAKQAQHGSLVDRGANGGLAGSDVRILSKSSRKCTVTGIDEHQINGLDIVQCAALVKTNHGYVNLIMNEYAYYGKGHTIHSSGQIEWNKNQVDDRSVKVGGSQCITTLDGYSFPLKCTGGLMYLNIMGKPTDEELLKYPSVHLTSIYEWDPSVLDYSHPEGDGEPLWACDPQHLDLLDPNFDTHGLYTKRAINTLSSLAGVQQSPPMVISSSQSPIQACQHKLKAETPDFDKYRPYFGWVNADTIRDTFKHTTQWGASVSTFPMRKHLKSRNPALNIPRRHEAVATDTVYSDTPAVDSGG